MIFMNLLGTSAVHHIMCDQFIAWRISVIIAGVAFIQNRA